jgi:hypothetical protein
MPSYYRGTKYSIAQMQSILRTAGWPEDLIPLLAAIGQAESSGFAGAVNDSRPREYSVGLWQINLLAHSEYNEAQMSDPLANAAAALSVYQNQGLRAWGPYVTGVYQKYMAASQAAYASGAQSSFPSTSGNYDDDYSSGNPLSTFDSTSGISAAAVVGIIAGALLLSLILDN